MSDPADIPDTGSTRRRSAPDLDQTSVVVTGIGVVCPAGNSLDASWSAVREGRRLVSAVTVPCPGGAEPMPEIGGMVHDFAPPEEARRHDRVIQFAMAAAGQALQQAGVVSAVDGLAIDPTRVCVAVGTSKGGILTFAEMADRLGGPAAPQAESLSRLFDIPPDAPSRRIAEHWSIEGGMHATVSACSTGTQAIIRGCRYLLDDDADLVICGGADASIHPLWLAAFHRMGVLARPHPRLGPGYACRPFDVERGGFAVGEGAAVFVLETLKSARRRGVEPLARISGFAEGSDPTALTRMDDSGRRLAALVDLALRRAGWRAEALAAIHAHGTATTSNDLLEYHAYRALLGDALSQVPVVSLKGAIGHLLGAAGGVETAIAIQSMRTGMCPPHATLLESDPCFECLWLPATPVEIRPGPVLKTSLGFGGHLAALILEAV